MALPCVTFFFARTIRNFLFFLHYKMDMMIKL